MVANHKHYTGSVDVFSFGIMAAQVMVGRLVYDADDYQTPYGLCFFFSKTNMKHPFSTLFHSCFDCIENTAFVNAVCQGLRPSISGCSSEMKALISKCWDGNPSSRPCLSFSFLKHHAHTAVLIFDCSDSIPTYRGRTWNDKKVNKIILSFLFHSCWILKPRIMSKWKGNWEKPKNNWWRKELHKVSLETHVIRVRKRGMSHFHSSVDGAFKYCFISCHSLSAFNSQWYWKKMNERNK